VLMVLLGILRFLVDDCDTSKSTRSTNENSSRCLSHWPHDMRTLTAKRTVRWLPGHRLDPELPFDLLDVRCRRMQLRKQCDRLRISQLDSEAILQVGKLFRVELRTNAPDQVCHILGLTKYRPPNSRLVRRTPTAVLACFTSSVKRLHVLAQTILPEIGRRCWLCN
jgi:hypothetical protein